ncbi:MAG: helical backbone metal receptor, partial [Actinomycetes bacterium]
YETVGGTKNPDIAGIVALGPDLVVVDREENRREDAEALGAAGVPVHVMHVRGLDDVAPELAGLAAALHLGGDRPENSTRPGPIHDALRVWVPIWRRPWMSINASTYGSSILEAAGFVNVLGGDPEAYPEVELEAVAALHPQRVLAPSEPYAFRARHQAELEQVAPVTFVDGKDMFWWGSRTPGALRRLAALARTLS